MAHRSPLAAAGALLAALVVGGLVAVQSHLNGTLAGEFGGGVAGAADAALSSFGIGFVLLCLICALVPRARHGLRRVAAAVRTGGLRPWQLVGGTAGALLVASQGLTVGTIGVALFTVAVVAGQTSSALLVDKAGIGPAGHRAVTTGRAVGAGLAVAAVALAVSDRLDGAAALAPAALLLAALPLLAGSATAWQQALNGQVSVAGGPWAAAWVNFCLGTALLAVFALLALAAPGAATAPPSPWGSGWWLYAGGPIGVVFISAAAVLVRVLGVLVFGLCTVAGQVLSSLLIDLVVIDVRVGALTVAGAMLTLVGVAVAALSGRRAQRRRAASSATAAGGDGGEAARAAGPPRSRLR